MKSSESHTGQPGQAPAENELAVGLSKDVSNSSAEAYVDSYSENGFRDKLNRFAKTAGRELVEKSLYLYYAAQRPETPAWAKATVYAALGYFIVPTDAIPDLTPLLGFGDDLGAITLALATIAAYVTPEVKQQAATKMRQWFGDETSPH